MHLLDYKMRDSMKAELILLFVQRRLIFSRKNILLKQQEALKTEVVEKIKEGEVFEGIIKDIKDYGIFVDIGGFTGLVHISEISWDRSEKIKEQYKIGEKINVQVISFDQASERLSLSIKSLAGHPWDEFISNYKVGDIVTGEVKNIKGMFSFKIDLAALIPFISPLRVMSINTKSGFSLFAKFIASTPFTAIPQIS